MPELNTEESKRCTLFDNVKVERGTFVFRNGKAVPKNEALAWDVVEKREKRSDLPAPMIMKDIEPYQSMIDGSMITSRSHHREHLRNNNCEEVGNETLSMPQPTAPARGEIAREIKETIEKLEAGFVDPELGPTHDGEGNPIIEPDLEPVVVPEGCKNGDIIRTDAVTDPIVSA